jgi:hypothetical protein
MNQDAPTLVSRVLRLQQQHAMNDLPLGLTAIEGGMAPT